MEGCLEAQSPRQDKTLSLEVLHKFVAHEGKFVEENHHTRGCLPTLLRTSGKCHACSMGLYEGPSGLAKEFWLVGWITIGLRRDPFLT